MAKKLAIEIHVVPIYKTFVYSNFDLIFFFTTRVTLFNLLESSYLNRVF